MFGQGGADLLCDLGVCRIQAASNPYAGKSQPIGETRTRYSRKFRGNRAKGDVCCPHLTAKRDQSDRLLERADRSWVFTHRSNGRISQSTSMGSRASWRLMQRSNDSMACLCGKLLIRSITATCNRALRSPKAEHDRLLALVVDQGGNFHPDERPFYEGESVNYGESTANLVPRIPDVGRPDTSPLGIGST